MSKKRDPVLAVLHYFKTADLALSQQALALAQAVLKDRSPRAVVSHSKTKSRKVAAPAAAEGVPA